ncbi:hypothetical protein CAEBREN_21135 [Caenorhabditis brenneri]|uniref:Uncharacterized protein n=1 Tax=Caenorhabditis brenneri TaxID=135651 RepID=G0MX57_CAEBE|nr:hypothetical protein CAEBREN_21135 [Caenorhabditis brenneri]
MDEKVELPGEPFKEILNELFADRMTVTGAHTKFEEEHGEGQLTLEKCNNYYLRFIKQQNDLKRAERYRAIDAQEPPPHLVPKILESAEDYRARSQQAIDDWNASRGIKIEAFIEEIAQWSLEEESDEMMKRSNPPEVHNLALGASEDLVARAFANATIGNFENRVRNPEEQFEIKLAIHGYFIEIETNGADISKIMCLPHGCAAMCLDSSNYQHSRTSAVRLSIELLIALLNLEQFNFTSLRLRLAIPYDRFDMEHPETTEICCSFLKAFELAKNKIDTSNLEMKMEFTQPVLYEKAQSLIQFTPVSVVNGFVVIKWAPDRIYLQDEERLKEVKLWKELAYTVVTFKF